MPNQQTCQCLSKTIPFLASHDFIVSKPEFEEEPAPPSQRSPVSPSFHSSRLNRFLSDLGLRPNDSPQDLDDSGLQKSGTTRALSFSEPLMGYSKVATSESMRN